MSMFHQIWVSQQGLRWLRLLPDVAVIFVAGCAGILALRRRKPAIRALSCWGGVSRTGGGSRWGSGRYPARMPAGSYRRRSARGLLLDGADRILLFRLRHGKPRSGHYW